MALAFSPKRITPTGTSTTGVSETMNSALATVVCVTALKNSVMLTPNAIPGTIAMRSSRRVTKRRSTTHSVIVQMIVEPSIRQNAIVGPGIPAFLMSELLTLNISTASATPSIPRSIELLAGRARRLVPVVVGGALIAPAS